MKATQLNQENFDATINDTSQPVLVDFWAEWCGPCKMLGPIIEEIADEQEGKAIVAKVNIDDSPDLAARFGIQSIPTLIVFKDGEPVSTLQGVQPKSKITASLANADALLNGI
ncbi:thioredoxin [bacterium]|jgi:thioredoxin 1|nr:thioredoxin [Verrucomicrobiota bacterium]MDA7633699.1 thioredoxin [bacterium]MDA7667397.1 thioredoxin [bacterium]